MGLFRSVSSAVVVASLTAGAIGSTPDSVGESQLVTSIGETIFSGSDVGTLVGADRFYDAGYDGGGTIVWNIEAGHLWNGHDALSHVSHFSTGTGALGDVDRHATWVAHALAGRGSSGNVSRGIAYGADLRSGAIATGWAADDPASSSDYRLSFGIDRTSFYGPYADAVAGGAAAINGSYGLTDSAGVGFYTTQADAFAAENPFTTFVFAAGNSGDSGTNTVGGPGSGYNSITVGALRNNGSEVYDRVASFSSRGPQSYGEPGGVVVNGVRAPVDIVAPGTTLTLAYYGGSSGGNAGNPANGTSFTYSGPLAGTSFADPLVAGGVALMHDAALDRGLPTAARDSRVIKANLLNAADKVLDRNGNAWDNGQVDAGGFIRTTQSLDYDAGAGGLNLDRTFDQFLSGQTDITGNTGGVSFEEEGWDFARVSGVGGSTDVVLPLQFQAGSAFTATLTWFRERTENGINSADDAAFADLDLQLWDADFTTLIAESVSDYNSVEHLHLTLSDTTDIGLRVIYDEIRFGAPNFADFALAWSGVVPEPATAMLILAALALAGTRRRAT